MARIWRGRRRIMVGGVLAVCGLMLILADSPIEDPIAPPDVD